MTSTRTQFETVYRPLVGPMFSTAGFQEIRREPIPWCTTHSSPVLHFDFNEKCWAYVVEPGACLISTGGPDHKWWKDTE